MKKAQPIKKENGKLVFDPYADAANADWIRAARLKTSANSGDKKAAKELADLGNTALYEE